MLNIRKNNKHRAHQQPRNQYFIVSYENILRPHVGGSLGRVITHYIRIIEVVQNKKIHYKLTAGKKRRPIIRYTDYLAL